MNLKIKAGLIVAGMLGIGITAILTIKLALTYISAEYLPVIGAVVFLSFMLYLLYSITLDRLKYEAKISEMVDQKNK